MDRNQASAASLPAPSVPRDHGLTSLGLLMQLGGSVFLVYVAARAVGAILGRLELYPHTAGLDATTLVSLPIAVAAAVRSGFHRAAGSALVDGSPRGIFRPTYRYIGVALAQTALTLFLINRKGGVSAPANLSVALLLLAWPVTLLLVLSRPRLRRLAARLVLPPPDDMGFAGAAVLMLLLGLAGSIAALFMLYGSFASSGWPDGPARVLLVCVCVILLARSILHAAAGMRGSRGVHSAGAIAWAARYVDLGLVASIIAGGLLIGMIGATRSGDSSMVPELLAAMYLLFLWPLLLRRFQADRNFSAAAVDGHRREGDTGLTASGWLLLAFAILQLCHSLAAFLSGLPHPWSLHHALAGLGWDALVDADGSAGSPVWAALPALVQLWAAIELIGMTGRHRLAATISFAVSSGVTAFLLWTHMGQVSSVVASGPVGLASVAGLVWIASGLVLPVATLVLVNRSVLPAPAPAPLAAEPVEA